MDNKMRFVLKWTTWELLRFGGPIVLLALFFKVPLWVVTAYLAIAYATKVFLGHYSKTKERRRFLVQDMDKIERIVDAAHPTMLRKTMFNPQV